MANPFDQFDGAKSNPFDEFDSGGNVGVDLEGTNIPSALRLKIGQENPDLASQMGIPRMPVSQTVGDDNAEPSDDRIIPLTVPRARPLDENSTIDKVAAGVANTAGNFVNGLNTPLGAASLTLGGAPKLIQKAAALAFGAGATKSAAQKLGEASVTKDPELITEGALEGAIVPFLARPTVKLGENIALTKNDALGIGARDLARQVEGTPIPPADIAPRQITGISPDYNPLNVPSIQDIVEQGLREAQPGNIAVPGEVPAVDKLRLERLRPLAERQFNEAQARDARNVQAADRVGGGNVSFAGEADAGAIPSARQAALEQARTATGELPQPPGLIDQVVEVVNNKDRLSLEQLRDSISSNKSRAAGIEHESQPRDVLRIINQRLKELETGKLNNENEALRKIIAQKAEPAAAPTAAEKPLPTVKASPPPGENQPTEGVKNAPQERIVEENNLAEHSGANPERTGTGSGGGDSVLSSGGEAGTKAPQEIIADYVGKTPEQFNADLAANNKDLTGLAYKLGEQVSAKDIPALEEARAKWVAENKAAKANVKTPEQFNEFFSKSRPTQFFEEAKRFRQALDAAAERGAQTKEEFAAIEQEFGVGKSDKGQTLMDAFERQPKEPTVEGVTPLDPQTGQPLSATDSLINRTEAPSQPTARKLSPEQERAKERAKNIADRAEAKLAEIQKNLRSGAYQFSGITGLEPVAIDGALTVARAALKATSSVIKAIEAATEYIQKNFPNAKFDKNELADWINDNISESKARRAQSSGPGKAPSPASSGKSLDDVYKIFEPGDKNSPNIKERVVQAVEAFRTGFSSKFRPLDKLAEDIAKQYGIPLGKGIAGIFEQLKGSSGKGEADAYRFDRAVSDLVKGNEKEFNAYMFLRRGLDRLSQDVKSGESRRGVADYTSSDLNRNLGELEQKLGPEKLAKFQEAADLYQQYMDKALKLQVDSGRMTPEVYAAIKKGNQFYAPFKVMKYIEETMRPEGTGTKIDTLADFTKAMEGIEDKGFRLGDMLSAARQNIVLSRILAEKNLAVQKLTNLAGYDTEGLFIRRLKPGQTAPKGFEPINVFENGKRVQYAVDPNVAEALQSLGKNGQSFLRKVLGTVAVPFRAGATALNVPFQASNLLADFPRQALISKYGIRGVSDLINYPADIVQSMFSVINANMRGKKNALYLDFLDSGVAGATVQEGLTAEGLQFKQPSNISKSLKLAKSVLNTVPDFAKAIEEWNKVIGLKRAMRFEGAESGAELAKKVPEAITELRRFSGSPDFGRQGKWVEQSGLNLIYMFLNARIQGTTADLGRLTGRDGALTAAKTWGKLGGTVGVLSAYAYLMNQDKEFAADYAARPKQEKQNYWLIPKPSFITTEGGEKIRDYWRIPKRESAKWIANMVESGLNFAEKRDPEAFRQFAQNMIEDISPVNIQGNTAQERLESVGASLNPLIKAPLELGSGRDMYRHKDIVPDLMKKASPENQYTERTPNLFKKLAEKMPDIAPDVLRSPLMLENLTKNMTAGLITQFLPKKPVEGRNAFENNPFMQRFQALPFTDSTEFDEKISKFERDSADDQLKRFRDVNDLVQQNKNDDLVAVARKAIDKYGPDEKLIQRLIDVKIAESRGITPNDRRIMALPVEPRARYILGELKDKTPEQKSLILLDYSQKRILTEAVAKSILESLPDSK